MAAPFGPKTAVDAEAGDLVLVSRGTGAALETVRLGTVAAIEVAETPAAIDAALAGCAASLALVPVP